MTSTVEHQRRSLRSFLVDNLITGLAQLLGKTRGLILIPLLVKGLGTEAYGLYAQIISFAAFTGSILALNLHLPFLQFTAADRKSAPSVFATLLPATLSTTALGCVLLGLAAGADTRRLMVGAPDAILFELALSLTFSQIARTFLLNGYRATDRIKLRGGLDLLGSLGDVLVAILVVVAGGGLATVILASTVWGLGFAGAMFVHELRLIGWGKASRTVLNDALRFSLPLIPASFGILTLDRADRFLLGGMLGPAAVGAYSAQLAIASLIGSLLLPLQITLLPKVSSLWATERETAQVYLETSYRIFVAAAMLFVFMCPVVVPAALTILANKEVAEGSGWNSAFIALGTSMWGVGVLQATVLYTAKRTAIVGIGTAVAAALNIALNVILIPRMGLLGASIAKLAAYACTTGLLAFGVSKVMTFRYSPGYLAKCVLAAAAAVVPFLLCPNGAIWRGACTVAALPIFLLALSISGAFELKKLRSTLQALRSPNRG